eukprot:TRINITY_DN2369_c0_g2_i1.p1 TRINITY_DN2369_c0_g2~~TRINITY_DN2369_c0_g2_i1.p1  ORF type:complete len:261 (-),score=40.73 TRINITY_DN2369_c0_g2_i1:188-901(-)
MGSSEFESAGLVEQTEHENLKKTRKSGREKPKGVLPKKEKSPEEKMAEEAKQMEVIKCLQQQQIEDPPLSAFMMNVRLELLLAYPQFILAECDISLATLYQAVVWAVQQSTTATLIPRLAKAFLQAYREMTCMLSCFENLWFDSNARVQHYLAFSRRFCQLDNLPLEDVPGPWRLTSPQQRIVFHRAVRMVVLQATRMIAHKYDKMQHSKFVELICELELGQDPFLTDQINLFYETF